MKITVLEKDSVTKGDIDYSPLNATCEVTYHGIVEPENVSATIGDSDGVIVNKTLITAKVMDECKNLKYIGTFATGYNNIDIDAAKERGITVCNVPAYSTEGVAQSTIAFILYTATSLGKYIQSVNDGDWKKCKNFCYYPYDISEVSGKTLGIIGFGTIGKRVAEIATALGMKVIINSRTKKESEYEFVSREEVFKRSDWLSLHLPLSKDSENLINETTLSMMKKSAILVNTARGGLIDENALALALKNGVIRASCHDVIRVEPMQDNCPLFGIENCYITPHVAWAGKETRQRLVNVAAKNVECFINGNPQNVVNK
ncbi:MAG: D-2-hydroxyacid dehydrogenase [Clostridia bacterium]|nr:D-2-hydroxyacid dehydrogenase [Clostridia bacterium]